MKIRKAKLKDIDLIIPVFEDYEEASLDYLPQKYKSLRNKKKPLKKHIRLNYKKDITKKNSIFLVAEEDNKIVGYIFWEIRDDSHPLYDMPKTGEFNDIAVLNEY